MRSQNRGKLGAGSAITVQGLECLGLQCFLDRAQAGGRLRMPLAHLVLKSDWVGQIQRVQSLMPLI